MTPASLRTLMARAFAEEVEKHDHYRRSQQFINERGIAAAMRAAAENIGRSDYARKLSWGELVAIGLFLSNTGEIT